MKKRKTILISLVSILGATSIALSGITIAAFSTNTSVGANIQMKGRRPVLIYLNPGIWDIDNALFYMSNN